MTNKKEKFDSDDFTEFMEEVGIRAECEVEGAKMFVAAQIKQRLEDSKTSFSELARKMHTSRPSITRLFDPKTKSVTLKTLEKAAHAVNCRLKLELEPFVSGHLK